MSAQPKAAPIPVQAEQIKTNQLVRVFIKLRAKRAELKRAYEEEDEDLKQKQRQIENELLRRALEQKVTSFVAAAGTTYMSEERHVSIADADAFTAFLAEEEDPYLFFEQRPALGRVIEYQNAHDGNLPPGIRMFRENRMRVRATKPKKGEANGA